VELGQVQVVLMAPVLVAPALVVVALALVQELGLALVLVVVPGVLVWVVAPVLGLVAVVASQYQ